MALEKQLLAARIFTPKRLVTPESWIKHIPFAHFAVAVLRPDVIVELGVHSGNSFCAFCQAVAENNLSTRCYGIDTFAGDQHSRLYDETIFNDLAKFVEENFPEYVRLIRSSFAESVGKFKDKSINLLHIDGLHTYAAVSRDFTTWLPKLHEDGVILFHDIQVKSEDFGVWRLWAEIKDKYASTYQFDYGYGLGVLCLGSNRLAEALAEISAKGELETCFAPGWLKIEAEFAKNRLAIENENLQNQLSQVAAENQRIQALLEESDREVLQVRAAIEAIHLENKNIRRDAEELKLKCEQEKQEIWAGKLWLERQYNLLQQSKTYRVGFHLLNCCKLQEPIPNFTRLISLMLPVNCKMYLKEPSLLIEKIRPAGFSLQKLILTRLSRFKRPAEPLQIKQQPWSGPLVSVIVTCYNYGSFLDSVLSCLAAQTCRNFEIILIDDGSTDAETRARVAELKKQQQPDFTVMQQPNQGVIAARNNAIVKAQGKYIFPLDADDTIEPTFLEKCLLFLENSPEHFFVYTWTCSLGDKDFIWETRDSDPEYALIENRMGYALFRKSAFMQVGGYNPVMAGGYEDWEFCVNLVAHGYIGRVIKEPLYNYYVKPGARNYHAIKKHDSLRVKINELHQMTIKTQKRHLFALSGQAYLVENPLVNFAESERERDQSEFILLDLYNSDIDVSDRFSDLSDWFEKSPATVLLTLKTPWVEFFSGNCPENLFVYYPEQYHPEGDVKPFYDYLELYYRPQIKDLRELCQ